jgi:hypothetical protein
MGGGGRVWGVLLTEWVRGRGFIDTPMQQQSSKTMREGGVDDEARKEKRIKSVALGRGG